MNRQSNGYIDHLESKLGELDGGILADETDGVSGFSVVKFRNQPLEGATTYLTLGLSKHIFQDADGTDCSQELLFSCFSEIDAAQAISIPYTLGLDLMQTHRAAEKGQILPPRGPMATGATVESAMFYEPFYFPGELDLYLGTQPPIRTVAILPLTRKEAIFGRDHGWESLIQLIEEQEPNLLDPHRKSIC